MTIPILCSIDDHWPEVERGLAVVAKKAPANWTPEAIRERCRIGRSHFFKVPEGFFILDTLAGPPVTIHIKIAYGTGGGLIAKYLPHIEKLARMAGAEQITFQSTRTGYRRAMRGWHLDGIHYMRALA
jgi:hypothetical protein